MESSTRTVARQATAELLEVSPQVEVALVATRTGTPIAASLRGGSNGDAIADRLGAAIVKILDQAERARVELGREPVTQCEVGCGDGSVFVVADANHLVAAVTDAEPTVGLVFYDLKTALRTVREAASADDAGTTNGSDPSADTADDTTNETTEA